MFFFFSGYATVLAYRHYIQGVPATAPSLKLLFVCSYTVKGAACLTFSCDI